jgi:phosphatidylglycerophosphatase A
MAISKERLFELACTSFRLGYSPFAPGSVGSLPAVAIFLLFGVLAPREYHAALIAMALLVSCFLTVLLGDWAEKRWDKVDPRCFVLDEYAGFFMTVLIFRADSLIATAIWGFVFTRIADIIKPIPANKLEAMPGGWGMLLDDVAASVWAGIALIFLAALFPAFF